MIKKDFKQKYFLYCQDCIYENKVNKFGSLKLKPYICRIKIEEHEKHI
jgi:hypothetical protein